MLVSNSFSKIFSLYGERVGGLSVVCEDSETAGRVLGQLKATVRRNYSSPPSFGAQVVATVLNDAGLKATWQAEVDAMRAHILTMRQALVDALQQIAPAAKWITCSSSAGCSAIPDLARRRWIVCATSLAST